MNEFIDTFIKNKANEIPDKNIEYINKFLPFYASIYNDDLAYLFAYLHFSYNRLFEFLNNKLTVNNHYNAEESRDLIAIIDLYKKLKSSLSNTQFEFNLDTKYLDISEKCETFLSSSGGSVIPEDFLKIELIEIKPIFKLLNPINQDNTTKDKKHTDVQTKFNSNEINKVFIVHGHDDAARQTVCRFVERLGLEAIILHEQLNQGQTIIEKFERYSDVGFAIAILSPDDLGRSKQAKKLNTRARQNVILELGYFIGKLGRNRVCSLKTGDVEIPSDILGVIWQDMDNVGAWQLRVAREMQAAGYNIDLNRLNI